MNEIRGENGWHLKKKVGPYQIFDTLGPFIESLKFF